MKRAWIVLISTFLSFIPIPVFAEVPSFPHLAPPAYKAPLTPGYYQLTWVGLWQIPPRPEFTNIPSAEMNTAGKYWLNYGNVVFPKCSKEIVEKCISAIDFKKQGDSNWSSAKFLKYLPVTTLPFKTNNRDRYVEWAQEDIDWKRNNSWQFDSARSSLWEVETSQGKTKYLATVSIQYEIDSKIYSQFKLNLTPVIELNIKSEDQYKELDPNKTWCARTGYGDSFFLYNNFHPLTVSNPESNDYDYCLIKTDFDPETLLRISTQLSPEFKEKKNGNWLGSRTTETRAYSKSLGKEKPTLATFEGLPVSIQAGVTQIPRTLEGFNSWYEGNPFKKSVDRGEFDAKWFEEMKKNWGIGTQYSGGEGWGGLGWEAIDQWNSTERYIDPSMTIEHDVWEFFTTTLEEAGDSWVTKCKNAMSSAPSFSGVISTNATVFVQGPPKLDSGGNLDFQVAGTSLKENGEVNLGTYNLSIADEVAKCIWGTSNLGVGASVSVITQEGVKQVATTSMGKSDGQLNFAASGFHYSTNKISISMGAKVQNSPTNMPKKSSITCVKGDVSKKVTAIKPKCPAGYKKK
jgi:hypothetical protein